MFFECVFCRLCGRYFGAGVGIVVESGSPSPSGGNARVSKKKTFCFPAGFHFSSDQMGPPPKPILPASNCWTRLFRDGINTRRLVKPAHSDTLLCFPFLPFSPPCSYPRAMGLFVCGPLPRIPPQKLHQNFFFPRVLDDFVQGGGGSKGGGAAPRFVFPTAWLSDFFKPGGGVTRFPGANCPGGEK